MTPDEIVNTKPTPKPDTAEVPAAAAPPARKRKVKSLYDRLDISRWVGYDMVIQNMAFILFIALLALLYIWNNHNAIRNIKTIGKNDKQIKQLKWEYLTAKSELEGKSKQSEVARLVEPLSIRELKTPPAKIYVNQSQGN